MSSISEDFSSSIHSHSSNPFSELKSIQKVEVINQVARAKIATNVGCVLALKRYLCCICLRSTEKKQTLELETVTTISQEPLCREIKH